MAISFVGSVSNSSTANNYNIDLTPLSLVEGDMVVVSYGVTNAADSGLGVNTSGYQEVPGSNIYSDDSHDTNLAVAYKFMGLTPDTVVNVNGSNSTNRGSSGLVQAFRGVDPSNPLDVAAVTALAANSATPNPPAITPVTSGAWVVAVGAASGTVSDATGTAPSGYTNLGAVSSAGVVDSLVVAAASKVWSGSGAEDPGTFTGFDVDAGSPTTSSWAAVTLALRPYVAPSSNLDTDLWIEQLNPAADCTFSQTGDLLTISIPSGSAHDLTTGNFNAPVLLQASNNTNFSNEIKITSALTTNSQGIGLDVRQDNNNFLRFDFARGSSSTVAFVQKIVAGVPQTATLVQSISGVTYPLNLRVERTGDSFEFLYSLNNGKTFTSLVTFSHALTVTRVGIHATNAGTNPALNATIDYFHVDTPRGGIVGYLSAVEDLHDTAYVVGKAKIKGFINANEVYGSEGHDTAYISGKAKIIGYINATETLHDTALILAREIEQAPIVVEQLVNIFPVVYSKSIKSNIDFDTAAAKAFYRIIREFVEVTKPWDEAIFYETKPDEKYDLTLISWRVYGRDDEYLAVMAASGIDNIEQELQQKRIILPTESRLYAMKRAAGFESLAELRENYRPTWVN